ncbi:MAG: amino acid ABC transporter permease [Firmicutes bacterium]|nr:amino acid ABC transporter permease [Bacillota bacterium]
MHLIFPLLLKAALMTLILTVVAVGNGIIIGTFCGIGRLARNPFIRFLTAIYVDLIRGTPLLVQIFMVYFGLPPIIGAIVAKLGLGDGNPIHIPSFPAAIMALSINSGAYVTEIIRAGIQSIDRGQMEAARSLGMTHAQAMRYIILPQAMKRVIPPLCNEFIAMLKDSSLVSTIAMEELVRKGQIIATTYYRPAETWFAVAVIFLLLTLPVTRLVALLERKLKTGD